MRKYLFILLFPSMVFADAPKVLQDALESYVKKGRDSFMPTMLKGSPIEGDKSVLAQSNMLGQVQAFYGDPQSWEILANCELNDRVKTTFYILYFDKGPLFGSAESYKKKSGDEIITRFKFHTEQAQILPYSPINKSDLCGK